MNIFINPLILLKHFSKCKLLLLTLSHTLLTFSQPYEQQDGFFNELEKSLLQEYTLCTGDSSNSNIDKVLLWKKGINQQTAQPEYQKMLKEFILHTGIIKDIIPCQVLNWYRDRTHYLHSHESSISKVLLSTSDSLLDSVGIAKALANCPPSPFDFEPIPFGLPQVIFQRLYHQTFSIPLQNMRKCLIAEHFPLRGSYYTITFYVTKKRPFFQYDIQGYTYPGDSLDQKVRAQADQLLEFFSEKAGKPDQHNRIGFFDIKKDTLASVAQWNREHHLATISIGLSQGRYYTKVSVVDNKVLGRHKR